MSTKAVNYAQSLLTRLWDREIPIAPDKIINKIDDIELIYESMPDNMSGKINYDFSKNKYIIAVNKNHHPNRQRFTVAHELGHYILNHGNKEDTLYRDKDGMYEPDEIEANEFAAELLMPSGVLRHLILEQGIANVTTLAQKFWVSEQAMLFRLKNLGFIS